MLKKLLIVCLVCTTMCLFTGCTNKQNEVEKDIIIGFSQSGIESSWRKRHTESILSALESDGYQVMYRNGLMQQSQQIQDIRAFIAYKVDMIVFTPIAHTGWDAVLKEAKQANIPVILVDRDITINDASLFTTHIGPNFKAEGNRAGIYASSCFSSEEKQNVNILEISGNEDSYGSILRHSGFVETIKNQPKLSLTIKETLYGNYTRTMGEELMRNYIKENNIKDIDIIYSHSDEMTLGILDTLDFAGIEPGKDIKIISIDGQNDVVDELKKGRVNCIVECNPDAGPYLIGAIERYFKYKEEGLNKEIPREIYMTETVFSDKGDLSTIPPRNY